MPRTRKYLTRLLAVAAIAVVAIAVVAIVGNFHSDDSSHKGHAHQAKEKPKKQRTKAKTYTVQSGDTLTAIAHRTGIPVEEILTLNPEVDPQILIAGETLKLR